MWKYSDLCQAFYISTSSGGLKSYTSQGEIAEFFIRLALSDDVARDVMPTNISTYNKWYYGTTGQSKSVWVAFRDEYEEESYASGIENELDENNLTEITKKLGVKGEDDNVDIHRLAVAIARQMAAFVCGRGEAENIISGVYHAGNYARSFDEYIEKSIQRYNVLKLIGGDVVPLKEFFVCNTIGEREKTFSDRKQIKCVCLEDPDMQSIRDIYKKRGYDNRITVLIGSGGCGKSLMLQHLFIQSAERYQETGVLPIFLELRHFKESDELIPFIVKSVCARDESFNETTASSLLMSGKCQLMLDGFDEIDPNDINSFLRKFDDFATKYDKVQIVITSRQSDYVTGINNRKNLYVWPFGSEQSLKLIDKILEYQGNVGARDEVIQYINNGFLKKDGVFSSHPLLLTYVTMKYQSFKRFNEEPSLFYKVTFEALLSGHDDNKKPYDRVFMSVDNAEQFSTVFKEFCALTYKDGMYKFNSSDFEKYFEMLRSHEKFENPHKLNIKNFRHDVTSTACMMYEKEYDLLYIDPGFQECLFAEYYAKADVEEVLELEKSLQSTSLAKLERFDALDMFFKSAELKFKFYLLLPFLEGIFAGDDNQKSFTKFLYTCFDEINVVNINETVQLHYMKHLGLNDVITVREENYTKTILLNYVLKLMGENPEFEFVLYAKEMDDASGKAKTIAPPDEVEETGIVIAQSTEVSGKKCLLIDCKPIDAYNYLRSEHLKGNMTDYIVDDNSDLVRFGSRLTIDGYYLLNEKEKYQDIVDNMIVHSKETYELFLRMKRYYKQLMIEKHRSGIN